MFLSNVLNRPLHGHSGSWYGMTMAKRMGMLCLWVPTRIELCREMWRIWCGMELLSRL